MGVTYSEERRTLPPSQQLIPSASEELGMRFNDEDIRKEAR